MSAQAASLQTKLEKMKAAILPLERVAVAFSGGVDSTFVLKVAADSLGANGVVAVTGVSGSVATAELEDARQLALSIGVRHVLIEPGEFDDPNYTSNPTNRCYFCKTALYSRMAGVLREHGLRTILNGTNTDDLGDHRPGLAAAAEHDVRSPCVDAGLSKPDIRALSRSLGLPTHDKPAAPCLSSRVQYGEAITPEKLRMIERGETFLRDLGIKECRVRHHDRLARLEVPAEWIDRLASPALRGRVERTFRELGYLYVTVDLGGFRSGSLNQMIALGNLSK